MQYLILLHKLL